jgi:hypothetical protein
MLKQFGHEVWIADGPDVVIVGFHYPTRMAVIRLSDGRLFIWSPIQLTDILRAEVDALGQGGCAYFIAHAFRRPTSAIV